MKIVLCVEFYHPSVGGVQEVVRQLAERFSSRGHEVTVATTWLEHRVSRCDNGVNIVDFKVRGNRVRGLTGEVESYREFLVNADADIVFFYAAQQWTFDAAWEVLPAIKARTVLVPCGYSGLYVGAYADYFRALPEILREIDGLIYHAREYRDVSFARSSGVDTNSIVIPNGAAVEEFQVPLDPVFRAGIGISQQSLVLMTVGTVTGLKGHSELVRAFASADFEDRDAVLILNGNRPYRGRGAGDLWKSLTEIVRGYGPIYAARHLLKMSMVAVGWRGDRVNTVDNWAKRINEGRHGRKRVLQIDMPRRQLIQAYLQSDLFVFASNIEYSPLVLYEACAAGLPFLTVPVGNTEEIVEWTGGGLICDAPRDEEGYTRVQPETLARAIEQLLKDPTEFSRLGEAGRSASRSRFNWAVLAVEYEQFFQTLLKQDKRGDQSGRSFE
jgi:glycosyltransferase involved in cell wall biosynthesis